MLSYWRKPMLSMSLITKQSFITWSVGALLMRTQNGLHIMSGLNENSGGIFCFTARGQLWTICFADVLQRNSSIRARATHKKLKQDLVEHIWQKFQNE
jgi:hypothetical protein